MEMEECGSTLSGCGSNVAGVLEACGYFNCLPLADHFCDNTGLELDLLPI